MAKVEVGFGPAPKEGLPAASIGRGGKQRGLVYFDDHGLEMAGYFEEGMWPFRSKVLALTAICRPEGKNHDWEPDRAMRHCHLPQEARGLVVNAIRELYPVCPVKERCQIPGCWSKLEEGAK